MSDAHVYAQQASAHFRDALAIHGDRGPIGAVLCALADDTLTEGTFSNIVEQFGVRRDTWFRGQILDLFLGFVTSLLERSRLSPNHRQFFQGLRRQLAIPDGELMARRPVEIAIIVDEQLERILEDGIVEYSEELEQVELQAALGLGYDDYLLVSRKAFERLHQELLPLAERSPQHARKLGAIEPMYRLVTSRPRTLGARY